MEWEILLPAFYKHGKPITYFGNHHLTASLLIYCLHHPPDNLTKQFTLQQVQEEAIYAFLGIVQGISTERKEIMTHIFHSTYTKTFISIPSTKRLQEE